MMLAASQLTWYLTRGSGAVALLLLTLSAVLGMIVTIGWANQRFSLLVINGLHRNVSLLVVVFVVVHVATTVLDSFVQISVTDALVPFMNDYRRVWLGLGAVASDLLLALVVTSLLRLRIPLPAWRLVHWFAYACLPIAAVHALGTGTDVHSHLMVWLVAGCGTAVLATFVWRVTARRFADPRVTGVALTLAVLVPALITVWLLRGPLQATWGSAS